jgi:hypothetical protein
MRRLYALRLLCAIGSVAALQGVFSGPCTAQFCRICWTSTTTTGTTPLAPMVPAQMVGTVPTHQMPSPPTLQPVAAYGYVPYTYGYHYATTTPTAPVGYTPSAAAGSPLPVSPYTHLSGYDPDAPITPAAAGAAPSGAQSLGARILTLLRNNPTGRDSGSLLQSAINIFGSLTGFSPVIQDVAVLAKIADKVFQELQGTASQTGQSNTNTPSLVTQSPSNTQTAGAVATITFTVTVQSNGQVIVNQQGSANPTQNPAKPNPNPNPNPGGLNVPGQTPDPNKPKT